VKEKLLENPKEQEVVKEEIPHPPVENPNQVRVLKVEQRVVNEVRREKVRRKMRKKMEVEVVEVLAQGLAVLPAVRLRPALKLL